MFSAFLLRFQERCLEGDLQSTIHATRTETKTQKEQPDHLFAVPAVRTRTEKQIIGEGSEPDCTTTRPFLAFP